MEEELRNQENFKKQLMELLNNIQGIVEKDKTSYAQNVINTEQFVKQISLISTLMDEKENSLK